MIENYKGWDITLNWDNKDYLQSTTNENYFFNKKEKWIGVNSVSYTHLTLPTNDLV